MRRIVAILDAGAQYGKVIDRRVRELRVESVLVPMNTSASDLKQYAAIIISGGPESVYGEQAPQYDPGLFQLDVPILGICYGMQLLNYVHGGTVEKKSRREDGQSTIQVETDSQLFQNLEKEQQVLLTHGDSVEKVAPEFRVTALSDGLVAAIENADKKMYGVQFHPEVDLTENGQQILSTFLFDIAQLKPTFTLENREEKAIQSIQETVGDKNALVLVSGGVDSTVAAALVTKALGKEKVFALHVDTGFMRHNESNLVLEALSQFGLTVKRVNAQQTFLQATTMSNGKETEQLSQTVHPEVKRQIIGDTFIRVTEQALQDRGISFEDTFLVQGTLRPDLIESASSSVSKTAQTIKTHHNDTFLVRKLRDAGQVIEPLAEYHKDEVRELGRILGLPDELIWRQPFPGPGLAIRILCAETNQPEDLTSQFEALQSLSQADISVTLLPIKTVGVQGDGRSYSHLAGLSGEANWPELFRLAQKIPREHHFVNRVVYIFGGRVQAPVTGITPTKLSPEVITQLQAADAIVNELLLKHDLLKKISQVPVILFPVSFGEEGKRSIAIRTLITRDFMTGVPAFPGKDLPVEVLEEMVQRILKEVPGIARVVYDLSSKPPATTEWE